MAFFHNDLDPGTTDTSFIYVLREGVEPNRRFVLEFFNIPHYDDDASRLNLQVELFEFDNSIHYHYGDIVGAPEYETYWNGSMARIGVESIDRQSALQVYCEYETDSEDSPITAGKSFRFGQPSMPALVVDRYEGDAFLTTLDNGLDLALGQASHECAVAENIVINPGGNPGGYVPGNAPVLGGLWTATVDTSMATSVGDAMAVYWSAAPDFIHLPTNFGALYVDPSWSGAGGSGTLMVPLPPAATEVEISLEVPPFVQSLCGTLWSTQAAVAGTDGIQLLNGSLVRFGF